MRRSELVVTYWRGDCLKKILFLTLRFVRDEFGTQFGRVVSDDRVSDHRQSSGLAVRLINTF